MQTASAGGGTVTFSTQGSASSPHLAIASESRGNAVALEIRLKGSSVSPADPDCGPTASFSDRCRWFYTGLGVAPNLGVSNHALALVLFFLTLPVFTFLLGPLSSQSSRRHEFEADAFAADQTNAGHLVSALVKLYKDNASTLTPDPLYSAFYYSHPPAAQRIDRLLAHA